MASALIFVPPAAWYRKAADQGHERSQCALGAMYSMGTGVHQDHVESHKWTNLCATRTTGEAREKAVKFRDAVTRIMTPQQIARAQHLAREWTEAFDKWKK
jgi:TPR repeat protein